MTTRLTIFKWFLFTMWAVLYVSCQPNQAETQSETSADKQTKEKSVPKDLTITATDFLESNGDVSRAIDDDQNDLVRVSGDDSWMTFDVQVETAGRYKFEINAITSSETEVWMEDYIDNKDGRTYNITGSVPIKKGSQQTTSWKDGSPLNVGLHKMKLHVKGGPVDIYEIKFSLIRQHKLTPENLVQKTDGSEWKVVWSDEFDVDGLPDTSKWTFDIGNWGWGNNELQYYTSMRKENARVENGDLVIEARKNDMGEKWTSARLTTRGKTSFTYGRIEFRAKVPAEKGNWAAGWTLGDDYVDELSWPYCGEIDILESVGYEMDNESGNGIAHASAHCGAYYFKLGNQPTGTIDVKNMQDEYHIYAVDWTPQGITASVDGKTYFTYDDTSTELAWPFDKAQNIILNLAMGGGWGGLQGMDESVTSQIMYVDYVRVYEKN